MVDHNLIDQSAAAFENTPPAVQGCSHRVTWWSRFRLRSSWVGTHAEGRLESASPWFGFLQEAESGVSAVASGDLVWALGTPVLSSNEAGPGHNEFSILLESSLDNVYSSQSGSPNWFGKCQRGMPKDVV